MDLHELCSSLNLDEAAQRDASYAYNVSLEENSVEKVQKALNLPEASALRIAMAVRLVEQIPLSTTLAQVKAAQRTQNTKVDKLPVPPIAPMIYGFPSAFPLYPYPPYAAPAVQGAGLSDTTLYVRGLPLSTTEDIINDAFGRFGTIKSVRVQKDKSTGAFNGSVFVEYIHSSAAKLARIQMDKKSFGDRPQINVDFARDRKGQKIEVGYGHPMPPTQSMSLYVSGLPIEVDKDYVQSLFSRFGEMDDVRIQGPKTSGSGKIAFIDYKLPESAAAAIDQMNATQVGNSTIKVSYANTGKRKLPDSYGEEPAIKKARTESPYGMPAGYPHPSAYPPADAYGSDHMSAYYSYYQ